MKFLILLFVSLTMVYTQATAQYVKTDSIDLGEDRSSHNYQEYGSTVKVGTYSCDGDQSISIGANNKGDAIEFDFNVFPNTDRIMVKWNYSWFNAGEYGDLFTHVVIDDEYEESMYSPGQNAVGSHPVSCNLDSHMIVFSGVSAYTGDGTVKVRIYDPFNGFSGNGSICKFEIYSDTTITSSIETQFVSDDIKVYPNPFINRFSIKSNNGPFAKQTTVQLFDILGKKPEFNFLKKTPNEIIINTDNLQRGIYFIIITDDNSGEVLWSQQVFKE